MPCGDIVRRVGNIMMYSTASETEVETKGLRIEGDCTQPNLPCLIYNMNKTPRRFRPIIVVQSYLLVLVRRALDDVI